MNTATTQDPQARYEQLTATVLRMGHWLTGSAAQLLSDEQWEERFAEYQRNLAELRRLGDQIRPVLIRHRAPLPGDALVEEVARLFAGPDARDRDPEAWLEEVTT